MKTISCKKIADKMLDYLKTTYKQISHKSSEYILYFATEDSPYKRGLAKDLKELDIDMIDANSIHLVKDGYLGSIVFQPYEADINSYYPTDAASVIDNLELCDYGINATAEAVRTALDIYCKDLPQSAKVVVVGRGKTAGLPIITTLLKNSRYTIISCNSKSNLDSCLADADVIIGATGVPNLITSNMTKNDAILIEVGASFDKEKNKWVGDFDKDSFASTDCTIITNVGLITRKIVVRNTVINSKCTQEE